MARDENPPFPRGTTFYQGGPIDQANLGGVPLEGKEYIFEDFDPRQGGTGAGVMRTQRKVRCRIVRNVGTFNLFPKMLVMVGAVAGKPLAVTAGHTTTAGQDRQGVVDEYLPAAGVPPGDLFYVAVEGPSLTLTPGAAMASNIAVGDRVSGALAGATTGDPAAGRVAKQDLTGATGVLGAQIQNSVGRAMSAATTAQTNAGLLVDLVIL